MIIYEKILVTTNVYITSFKKILVTINKLPRYTCNTLSQPSLRATSGTILYSF